VREESGALAALVGLSGPTVRLTRARRLELRPRIIEIAAEIQDRLTSS
jgi:DNA-binding IclR family transcriptional regulator